MTDFMTALPVILVQLTCPKDQRAKGAQFQLTCNLCRGSHKTQVWLCFLVLSFLSTSMCSTHEPLEDLKICLENVKHTIKKSDAMLYAPSTNDIKENCRMRTLQCYMLELIMVLDEEEIVNDEVDCIIAFKDTLHSNPKCCESKAQASACSERDVGNMFFYLADKLMLACRLAVHHVKHTH